jgi:hypothetical protein
MSLCACGCGQDAGVYVENGKSKRFIHGHNRKAAKKEQCVKGHPNVPGSRYANGNCKQCQRDRLRNPEVATKNNAYRALWRTAHPENVRNAHYKQKYGLTCEAVNDFLIKQNNQCAICPLVFSYASRETTPCVDHDHSCCPGQKSCGKCVRGLVCRMCNVLLGAARDNTTTLQNSIKYLNKCKGTQTCQNARNTLSELKEPPTAGAWVKP